MTKSALITPQVVSIELPQTERRLPFVVVHVAVGPLTMALGVALPRSGRLEVRRPLSITGEPAVAAAPELWAEIEALAMTAAREDPEARRHLNLHRVNRWSANPEAHLGV